MLNPEMRNEQINIREQKETIGRTRILHKGYKTTYNFPNFKTIGSFLKYYWE